MYKYLFLLSLFVLNSYALIAQTPERQRNRNRKPNNFSWGATNGQTNSFSRDTTRNLKSDGNEVAIETLERNNKTMGNTKLDDLKNPFDTSKRKLSKTVPASKQVNMPDGFQFPDYKTNTGAGQNHRSMTPHVRNQKWIDDSLLWVKNGKKQEDKNFSWGESNAGQTQTNNKSKSINSQQARPIKNQKMDDLKKPFDTTKKFKPVSLNNNDAASKDYIGETEKNRTVSQKPINSFQEVSGIGMEVKKDSAKKIMSPRDASSGQLYRKNKNNPTRKN